MCGRTALLLNKDNIRSACSYQKNNSKNYEKPLWLDEHNNGKEYAPSYNIAPTDITPVLVSSSNFKNEATERIVKPMMWGTIPPWHKEDYRKHGLSTNNCRLENIKNSKLFSPILKAGGRCVIIAEGFYEWQTTNNLSKDRKPYYIYNPQEKNIKIEDSATGNYDFNEITGWNGIKLIHMAGLYSVWQSNQTIIYSYSIITMESNEMFSWLHHRVPAILNEEQVQAWLDIDNVNEDIALSYLQPPQTLSWYQVSSAVNNSKNKTSQCNKRLDEESNKNTGKQKQLTFWFAKKEKRQSSEEILPLAKKFKK